jgi:hypothetical protein
MLTLVASITSLIPTVTAATEEWSMGLLLNHIGTNNLK